MPARKRQAPLPSSVQDFDKRRAVFEAWLLERGSSIKQITNPYEVIRLMGVDAECIVYRKASGMISHWANGAAEAYRAFLDGTPICDRDRTHRGLVSIIIASGLNARIHDHCQPARKDCT